MNVLGIHDGHVATACLFRDGRLTDCASEERFNRKKAAGGFPEKAVDWILRKNGLKPADIDHFVFPTVSSQLTDEDLTSPTALNVLRRAAGSGLITGDLMRTRAARDIYGSLGARARRARIFDRLHRGHGVPRERISFYDHHRCHVASALFFSGRDSALAFTLDGAGDGLSGTVTRVDGGRFHRQCAVAAIDTLGGFYSGVTEYLGMKRLEHEYKIMGLAPYGEGEQGREVLDIFRGYIALSDDGLGFRNITGLWGQALARRMSRDLFKRRFDHVCWAAQALLEELVTAWVHNWAAKTQVREAVFSGGVFMNVKVNQLLNESKDFTDVYFTPSCGDSSNAIGACVLKLLDMGVAVLPSPPQLLYLGPSFTEREIEDCLNGIQDRVVWEKSGDVAARAARLLADDRIIARCAGRMEFGERALGNRSILCNPRNPMNVRRINQAVKMRDFWMPFAPSILREDAERYCLGPRLERATAMMVAYRTTESGQKDLPAALHAADHTCRPHVVHEAHNPAYHKLLTEFRKLTGVGALLNTSFNIHGEPIVCSPRDAVDTLLSSQLDAVVLEDFIVTRK